MACPRCGTDCHCPPTTSVAGAHVAVLIDPDRYDPSEEQFLTSLDTTAVANASGGRGTTQGGLGFAASNVALAVQDQTFYRPRTEVTPDDNWRDELNDRLSTYRSRRRRAPHGSMRLAFEPEPGDNRSSEDLAREAARAKRKPTRLAAFVEEAAIEAAATAKIAEEQQAISAAAAAAATVLRELMPRTVATAMASMTAPAIIPNISFAPDRGGYVDFVYQFMAVTVKPLPGAEEEELTLEEMLAEAAAVEATLPEPINDAAAPMQSLPLVVNPSATPRPEAKLIEFPRAVEPVAERSLFDELAEPVIQVPRILEAEPDPMPAEPAPSFTQITLDAHDSYDPYLAEQEASELKVVPGTLRERAIAMSMDAAVALAASAVFAAAAWKSGHPELQTKSLLGLVAIIPATMWSAYQVIMLTYAGRTLGMEFAGLRLVSFEGKGLNRRQRIERALAMMLSAGSAGLGLLWAKIDLDELCWHDRITKSCEVRK